MGRKRREDLLVVEEEVNDVSPSASSPDSDCVGLIVSGKYEQMGANALKEYMKLADGRGVAKIKVAACGCSMSFKSADRFPKQTLGCPCGRHNHFIVKFDIE